MKWARALTVETNRAVCVMRVWHWLHAKARGGPACATGSSSEGNEGNDGEGSLDMASQGRVSSRTWGLEDNKSWAPSANRPGQAPDATAQAVQDTGTGHQIAHGILSRKWLCQLMCCSEGGQV